MRVPSTQACNTKIFEYSKHAKQVNGKTHQAQRYISMQAPQALKHAKHVITKSCASV